MMMHYGELINKYKVSGDQNECRDEIVKYFDVERKHLQTFQQQYRRLLNKSLINVNDAIVRRCFQKNKEHLRKEKEQLDVQLSVIYAPIYQREHDLEVNLISAYLTCHEKLDESVKLLKSEIRDVEKQIFRVDKEIYKLSTKTIPEGQHLNYVRKVRHSFSTLENQLEMKRKQEGHFCNEHAKQRATIIDLMHERNQFHKIWRKMVKHLNKEKEYLDEIVETVVESLDNSIDIYKKLGSVKNKRDREMVQRKIEMQRLLRKQSEDDEQNEYTKIKVQPRVLDDLEDREIKRRMLFKERKTDKLTLYKDVLNKVLSSSNEKSFDDVIKKFQEQESLYYSYFNYSNELNFQISTLNNLINELHQNIKHLQQKKREKTLEVEDIATDLFEQLAKEEDITKRKIQEKDKADEKIQRIFKGVHNAFNSLNCDALPLSFLLGDHEHVTIFNFQQFLKLLEDRMNKVISYVFVSQRKGDTKKENLTVKNVDREIQPTLSVREIVLAEQCPECAEGEDLNPYDEAFVRPFTKEQLKVMLREKVIAPEMQYRLHSLNECKLPRSKFLASMK